MNTLTIPYPESLPQGLHLSSSEFEREARMAMAVKLFDTVILDDRKARRIATALGLTVTGTLGILVQAKIAGQLPSVRDAIVALEQRGMWIAPNLAAKAISLAGENPALP